MKKLSDELTKVIVYLLFFLLFPMWESWLFFASYIKESPMQILLLQTVL